MKRLVLSTAAILYASAGAAYAAAPESVGKFFADCCAVAMACC